MWKNYPKWNWISKYDYPIRNYQKEKKVSETIYFQNIVCASLQNFIRHAKELPD